MGRQAKHGQFEVTDHYRMASRGAFVIGNIVGGTIRPGMRVNTGLQPSTLRINGVEFVDNLKERRHWNVLIFAEGPTLEFIKRAFPVGSLIEVMEDE